MTRKPTFWTDERVGILKRKYPVAPTIAELADELGCTESAVRNKAYKLKLRREVSTYTTEQFELVRKRYHDTSNMTLSVLSGVNANTLKNWAAKYRWGKSEKYYAECRAYSKIKQALAIQRWRDKNPEKVAEYHRRYKEKYPERVAESKRRFREKQRNKGLAEFGSGSARNTERRE